MKKKEQVKSLEKSFGLIIKSFKKQAGKVNRKNAYGIITERLTDINQYLNGDEPKMVLSERAQGERSEPIVANVQPSHTLFEKSSPEN